jgi:hypothetical protein
MGATPAPLAAARRRRLTRYVFNTSRPAVVIKVQSFYGVGVCVIKFALSLSRFITSWAPFTHRVGAALRIKTHSPAPNVGLNETQIELQFD